MSLHTLEILKKQMHALENKEEENKVKQIEIKRQSSISDNIKKTKLSIAHCKIKLAQEKLTNEITNEFSKLFAKHVADALLKVVTKELTQELAHQELNCEITKLFSQHTITQDETTNKHIKELIKQELAKEIVSLIKKQEIVFI
jgi:hypothetical protein